MTNTTLDFGRSSSLLLASLESARLNIRNVRQRVQSERETRKAERRASIDAHVRRLLPDAQSITFTSLARELPNFMTRNTQMRIDQWRALRVPILTLLLGGANRYRKNAETELLELIGTRLRSHIDSFDVYPATFEDLAAIDAELQQLELKDAQLAEQEMVLRTQISSISFTRQSGHAVPVPYAQAVHTAAQVRTPMVDDDSNLIMALLIDQVILNSMFSYDQSGEVSAYRPEAFAPGGGDFGGAGATGSWETSPEQPAHTTADSGTVSDPNPQTATFDDVSVDGLGAIS